MKKCPVNKMKKCVGTDCMWWTEIAMKTIATQEVELVGNCAIAWIPEMLKEQNRNTIGVAAAVESRGNEAVKVHKATNQIFAGMAQMALERQIEAPEENKRLNGADTA